MITHQIHFFYVYYIYTCLKYQQNVQIFLNNCYLIIHSLIASIISSQPLSDFKIKKRHKIFIPHNY